MSTLTIDLDPNTLSAFNDAAKREGKSLSAWAKQHLTTAATVKTGWPNGYFDTIAGFGGTEIKEPAEIAMPLDTITLDE